MTIKVNNFKGKSTTLHFLGGSKLDYELINNKKVMVSKNKISNHDLEKIKIGSSLLDSETQTIIPIRISTDSIRGSNESQVIMCDTPGFNDTRGIEIDIANGIAIRKCVHSCAGIKPVVLISSQWGDRVDNLKSLAKVLDSMFLEFKEDIRDFIYIYTKFSASSNESAKKIVDDKLDALQKDLKAKTEKREEIQISLKILVDDMVKKSVKSDVITIDPINGDREKILGRILTSSEFISKDLQFRISNSLSPEFQNVLQSQIDIQFIKIEKSIENGDYELAIYKLCQLKQLKDLLGKRDIENKFNAICSQLKDNFDSQYLKREKDLKENILNSDLLKDTEILNTIMFLKNIKKSNEFFKHFENYNNINKFDDMKKTICDAFQNTVEVFFKNDLCSEAHKIFIGLENLKNFADKFAELKVENTLKSEFFIVYESVKDKISKKAETFFNETKKNLTSVKDELPSGEINSKNNQLNYQNDLTEKLQSFKNLNNKLKNHFDESALHYEDLKTFICENIMRSMIEKFDNIIKYTNDEKIISNLDKMKEKLNDINGILSFFESLKCNKMLHQHIELSFIEGCLKEFNNKIEKYFDCLLKITEKEIKKLEENYSTNNSSKVKDNQEKNSSSILK